MIRQRGSYGDAWPIWCEPMLDFGSASDSGRPCFIAPALATETLPASGVARSEDTRLLAGSQSSMIGSALTIATVPGKNHVVLSWTPDPADCGYEVHRNTSPYFAPGPSTLQAVLPAGTASYVDYLAAGNVTFNYSYFVRGIACSTGQVSDSNRVGEFDFPLVNENVPWTPAFRLHGLNYSPYIGADENPNRAATRSPTRSWRTDCRSLRRTWKRIRTFGCNNDLREAGKFAHTVGEGGRRRGLGPEDTPQGQQANRNQIDCLKQLIRSRPGRHRDRRQ